MKVRTQVDRSLRQEFGVLGFVSLRMDISSEMIHSLLALLWSQF